MTNTSWNPPTGPPNGAPIRPADARHEMEEAVAAARARDNELRAELFAIVTARVQATDRLAVAADEVTAATSLAKRALIRSNESARAGQRADAAKWTAAAQVFAMRLRDARDEVAPLEAQLAEASARSQRTTRALAENVGRLQAVAAARLPMLSGRRAARIDHEVDEALDAISAPTAELVARATASARAAEVDGEVAVTPVTDDDLESELDVESTDAILTELRTELGVPEPIAGPGGVTSSGSPAPSDEPPDPSSETRGAGPSAQAPGTGDATAAGAGPATPGRPWPVPAARR